MHNFKKVCFINILIMIFSFITTQSFSKGKIYGESKTASSIFQLFNRGMPYIKAAYNCRKEL